MEFPLTSFFKLFYSGIEMIDYLVVIQDVFNNSSKSEQLIADYRTLLIVNDSG